MRTRQILRHCSSSGAFSGLCRAGRSMSHTSTTTWCPSRCHANQSPVP
ncbi:hypothetical protein DUNSADRAFT_16057 [Dunaliella salina]|uniref:Uncharacterized protein n=1 Tax=Dunaliella salina TaxID=3046 RepID=A0ABQ7G4D1_DUNSA|nr:hypothetical protein DUNSADRAFT_16057 [Dunaliella salina]|eukprot:KAF5829460.1 hypothetical protein DUNSADRAFT_16057 [Dunaliella salina]